MVSLGADISSRVFAARKPDAPVNVGSDDSFVESVSGAAVMGCTCERGKRYRICRESLLRCESFFF
jgi:hypothetical protein